MQTLTQFKKTLTLPLVIALTLVVATALTATSSIAGEVHVRWDFLRFDTSTTPPTIRSGGVAFASAISGSAPSGLKIKLTGSGTFEPAGSEVTGGGTWKTFSGHVSTGSGTYQVTKLVSFEFANFATPGTAIDLIGNVNNRANGTAVLRIEYSDGSQGTLGVGCHGPGSPDGIEEGFIATKGFVTYWTGEVPVPVADTNRTIFHVRQ